MVIKIGINGFGRVGRVVFRSCFEHRDLLVTAINDPAADVEYINYLIKYDSTHGKFKESSKVQDGKILIRESSIEVYHHKKPNTIPWHQSGVEYVIEASGIFTTLEKASGHLESRSVKKVLLTAPGFNVPMIILGVNERTMRPDAKVISCGSSTLYCLAPLIKVLENNFGIREGFVTSIHAMTPALKPLDGLCVRGKHWRDHRSIHQNIIPSTTGACRGLSKVLPQLKNKLAGIAFRVPIVNVSLLDISIRLAVETNLDEIMKCIENVSQSTMRNIINISKEETVSSDFSTDSHSCTVDLSSCIQLNKNFYKLVCWYENEYSYACRVIDTVKYCEYNSSNCILEASTSFDIKQKHFKPHIPKTATLKEHLEKPDSLENKTNNKANVDKTDERLEKVKREVSKMMTITDDLLRKSINNTFNLNAKVKSLVSKVSPTRNRLKSNEKETPKEVKTAEDDTKCSTITGASNHSRSENKVMDNINHVSSMEHSYFSCETNSNERAKYGELQCMQQDDRINENLEINELQENVQSSGKSLYANKSDDDIYDKLDSISGTDSNNSFQERKSLVINIKDVINSLDDIAQMEKICKIMEISDDLSDKLLLPLNNKKPNKNWSFKELCEQIQLNDFCNNVFGDNSVRDIE